MKKLVQFHAIPANNQYSSLVPQHEVKIPYDRIEAFEPPEEWFREDARLWSLRSDMNDSGKDETKDPFRQALIQFGLEEIAEKKKLKLKRRRASTGSTKGVKKARRSTGSSVKKGDYTLALAHSRRKSYSYIKSSKFGVHVPS